MTKPPSKALHFYHALGALQLRCFNIEDAEVMHKSLNNKEINFLTGTKRSFTYQEVVRYIQASIKDPNRCDFIIESVDNNTKKYGEISFCDIDWGNLSAHFRIALYDVNLFGKGIGTQASSCLLQYGFHTLKLHRVDLEVFSYNERAIQLYKKLGFKQEGAKRDALLWEGQYYDAILMGLLAPEFKQ